MIIVGPSGHRYRVSNANHEGIALYKSYFTQITYGPPPISVPVQPPVEDNGPVSAPVGGGTTEGAADGGGFPVTTPVPPAAGGDGGPVVGGTVDRDTRPPGAHF